MFKLSSNLKLLFSYLKPYYKRAIIGGIAMFVSVFLLLPTPLLTMYLIDNVLPQGNIVLLNILCLAIIGLLLIKALANYIQNLYFLKFNERVVFDIQLDIFQEIQKFSLDFFHKK